jgi:hypothetical protein
MDGYPLMDRPALVAFCGLSCGGAAVVDKRDDLSLSQTGIDSKEDPYHFFFLTCDACSFVMYINMFQRSMHASPV